MAGILSAVIAPDQDVASLETPRLSALLQEAIPAILVEATRI